jgi:integrase/recombinase XerD
METAHLPIRLAPQLAEDFGAAVTAYLRNAEARNLSPKTRQWYAEMLRPLVKFLEGLTPAQVTRNHIQEYLHSLTNYSAPTRNAHLRAVKAFFGWLHKEEYLPTNPTARVPLVKEFSKVLPTFSEAQVQSLLRVIKTTTLVGRRDYALCVLLLDTGLRISEALGLGLRDVDWTESTALVMGKGRKQRQVPFGNIAKRALIKWLEVRGEIPGQERIFVTQRGDSLNRHRFCERLRLYARKARIEGLRVSPHTFRYTFATMWLRSGGDLFTLQRILGHTTLEMVRRYAQQVVTDLQEKHRQHSPMDRMARR